MLHFEYSPYFRGLLRRNKVCIDPNYPAECRQLFEDENRRKSYVAKRGMKLDEVGRLLWDAGISDSRPGCPDEILTMLDQVMDHKPVRQSPLSFRLAAMLSDGKLYLRRDIRRELHMDPEQDVGRLIRRMREYPFNVRIRKVPTARGIMYGVEAKDLHKLQQYIPSEEAYG